VQARPDASSTDVCCAKRTYTASALFDALVSAAEQRWWEATPVLGMPALMTSSNGLLVHPVEAPTGGVRGKARIDIHPHAVERVVRLFPLDPNRVPGVAITLLQKQMMTGRKLMLGSFGMVHRSSAAACSAPPPPKIVNRSASA